MFEDAAIFIRARLGSTRLPRKHMLEIQGKPIIEHLIERVSNHTIMKTIVLCITENEEDDALEALAKKHELLCHRGKPGAVLQQYVDAANEFNIKHIVNIDGDDPLVDWDLIDRTAGIMELIPDVDYLTWEGYPLGCTPSGMSVFGLKWIQQKHKEGIEHVFAYCEKEPDLMRMNIKVSDVILQQDFIKDIRLTLDYPDDFKLFKIIFDSLHHIDRRVSFPTLMGFLGKNRHLLKINNYLNTAYKLHQLQELKLRGD